MKSFVAASPEKHGFKRLPEFGRLDDTMDRVATKIYNTKDVQRKTELIRSANRLRALWRAVCDEAGII